MPDDADQPSRPPAGRPRAVPRETAVFIGLLVVGLLVVGLATVADRRDGNGIDRAGTTGGTLPPPGPRFPTTTAGTTAPTGPGATTTTSSTAPSTTSSTATPTTAAGPTTTAPGTTTTTPASTTTAPPATVATRLCTPDQYLVSVGTTRRQYGPGEGVRVTAVVTDVSEVPCYLPEEQIAWIGPDGAIVSGRRAPVGCQAPACPPNFFPGQVRTIRGCWDQRRADGTQVPPGTYGVEIRDLQTSFELLAVAPGGDPSPPC